MWENRRSFVRFIGSVEICEENVRNVDLEEYNIGVCENLDLIILPQIEKIQSKKYSKNMGEHGNNMETIWRVTRLGLN